MEYKTANEQLTGRNHAGRKMDNNTYLERRGEDIALRLHSTDILTFKADGSTVVQTGGWKTVTTKDRLNNYLPFNYGLSQKRGVWYWSQYLGNGQHKPLPIFTDGDVITAKGKLRAQAKPAADKKLLKQRNAVNKYAKLYAGNGPLSLPGGGDCFYCQMVVSEGENKGKPLGDASGNHSHILSHIEEGYIVPSLALHALQEAKYGPLVIQACFKNPAEPAINEPESDWGKNLRKSYLPRAVRKYVLRRLGMPA